MRRVPAAVGVALLASACSLAATAQAQGPAASAMDVAFGHAKARQHPNFVLGGRVTVRGILCPAATGQKVHVRFKQRHKVVRAVNVRVRVKPGSRCGHFSAHATPRRTGAVFVRAEHRASAALAATASLQRYARVIAPHLRPGSRGPTVRLLQRQLRAAGFVPGQRGLYDARTARAVLAFRKLSSLPRTDDAPPVVFRRLAAGGGRFKVSHPDQGHHVEADLTHQVLALIDHGKVQRVYPLSSGKPSTPTVLGTFHVYSKTPGYNAKGMYFSNYFIRGYAIHGYAEVPTYPASHGCLRVPIPDAVSIYNWVRFGDAVDVYYRTPGHKHIKPRKDAGP